MKKHLIIGNGGAAISAVKAIRSISSEDEITIISQESSSAYSPVLITYYLSGQIDFEDIFLCDKAFYRQNRVKLRLGKKVVKVDTRLKEVHLKQGGVIEYDTLLVATGASPVIPLIEGINLPGVFSLYSAGSARKVLTFLRKKEHIAVIGAGLIGLQTVGALLNRDRKVLLVEMRDQILPQALDLQGAQILQEKLRQKGVDIFLGQRISRIGSRDSKKVISFPRGNKVMTDGVILTVGIRPNVDFLKGSGIVLASGVRIDQFCQTNASGVYAAGDVAEAPDPLRDGHPTMNASWPNAIKQGRVAGLNMAGKKNQLLQNLRYNAFTLLGLPCVSIGQVRPEKGIRLDEIVSQDGSSYRKLLFKDGFLFGAVLMGRVEDAGAIANIIERRYLFPQLQKTLQSHGVINYSMVDYQWRMTNLRMVSHKGG